MSGLRNRTKIFLQVNLWEGFSQNRLESQRVKQVENILSVHVIR